MRTAEEMHAYLVARVQRFVPRPGMLGRERTVEVVLRGLLEDLCFLDDRHEEVVAVREDLGRYGKLGVVGPFETMFGVDRECRAEVASVFAEHFHRLGYLTVERLVPADDWTGLTADVRGRFDARDVRLSEVVAAYGAPSLVVEKRVFCYAPADGSGWVFVDAWADPVSRYVPDKGEFLGERDDDPLVRDVRLPGADFAQALVLTLYGRVLRWGPGWWIDHPAPDQSAETAAIAAQLRAIDEEDPSHPRPRPA
jgi:hypothetical protein